MNKNARRAVFEVVRNTLETKCNPVFSYRLKRWRYGKDYIYERKTVEQTQDALGALLDEHMLHILYWMQEVTQDEEWTEWEAAFENLEYYLLERGLI